MDKIKTPVKYQNQTIVGSNGTAVNLEDGIYDNLRDYYADVEVDAIGNQIAEAINEHAELKRENEILRKENLKLKESWQEHCRCCPKSGKGE